VSVLPQSDTGTIAATATAPGRGGIGIIRVSGPAVRAIARRITGTLPEARHASFTRFQGTDETGNPLVIDEGIALFFPAPNSFTGEDVIEFHAHGGPVILDLLLREVVAAGARLARPGEFSERAYLNGKLDLTQAEAIADLIDSASTQAARNALRSLQGQFSARIHAVVEQLIQLRMFVEASIDFPEEEVDFLAESSVGEQLQALLDDLGRILDTARQGVLVREGMTLVLAGKPNAGKSSLMNCLAGRDTAIVTAIPGTTRDILREQIQIDGLPLHIVDTAGLRESPDEIEREGIRRAIAEIRGADRLLLVLDSTQPESVDAVVQAHFAGMLDELPPLVVVMNKCDLSGARPGIQRAAERTTVTVSALTGAGIGVLREHLKECVGYHTVGEGGFSARRRHLDALDRCITALRHGHQRLRESGAAELLAEDLRSAQQCLGEITGEFSSDELLGRIFSSFCIGK
jgi:tRNA modification GTPase